MFNHPFSCLGRVYTFGSNQWGQLALGHTKQTTKPSFVKSLKGKKVVNVACGRSHTLIATENEVFSCGANGENQVCAMMTLSPIELNLFVSLNCEVLSAEQEPTESGNTDP